jgi:regulator of protease activity HflC (stomatin/prohibitin superfamily)
MRKYTMMTMIAVMATMSACTWGKIEPGHVGVVVPLSGDEKGTLETTSNGWYMYSFNTQVYEFPVYNQKWNWTSDKNEGKTDVDESIKFGDKNGLQLGADVGIQFHVPSNEVTTLFKTYRQPLDDIRDGVLKMSVRNALNLTAQSYTAEDIFGDKRGEFFDKALARVRSEMDPNGLHVDNLYLNGNLALPPQIRDTIQAKLQATMLAQQKENEKRTVEAEAAKQVAKAEGDAKARVAQAQGEATAAVAAAEGEAKSAVAAAKGKADSLELEATAEADANRKIASSLTGPILELKKLEIQAGVQKAYAQKWQGGVPTTILPGQANGYLMDMRGMKTPAAAADQ